MTGREESARIVEAWLKYRSFPDKQLEAVLDDRAFVTEVVFGVMRRFRSLEWMRKQMAPRKPEFPVHAVLLVALYQLFDMDTVPDHAAVHEAVATARACADDKAAAFVNAVLRRALREQDRLRTELAAQKMGIRLSHPDELLDRWIRLMGEATAAELCQWNNERPDTVIAVCTAKGSLPALQERMAAQGLHAKPHPFDPDRYLVLPRGVAVADVPGYREGLFFVQDPSGHVAVRLLNPQPGETVLDACAAPGGKLMWAADLMHGEGRLIAADRYPDRLVRLKENVARQGWRNIRIVQADARRQDELRTALDDEAADAILLDVPCSNTGVMRRRPDARWRHSEARLASAVDTQRALLDAACQCLKPGGRLVYSTCSIEPEEDEEQVARWLRETPGFMLAEEAKLVPPATATDGAYAALLVKEGK